MRISSLILPTVVWLVAMSALAQRSGVAKQLTQIIQDGRVIDYINALQTLPGISIHSVIGSNGDTLLNLLAQNGQAEMVIHTVALGRTEPPAPSDYEQTAKKLAKQHGHDDLAQLLDTLLNNAIPLPPPAGTDGKNILPLKPTSVLVAAAKIGNMEFVEIAWEALVTRGTELDNQEEAHVAVEAAINKNLNEMFDFLITRVGFDRKKALARAAAADNAHAIERLLDDGVDVNAKHNFVSEGEGLITYLHTAASHLNEKAVDALIRRGADVNNLSSKGYSPLDFALRDRLTSIALSPAEFVKQGSVVRVLLKHGVSITDENRERLKVLNIDIRSAARQISWGSWGAIQLEAVQP